MGARQPELGDGVAEAIRQVNSLQVATASQIALLNRNLSWSVREALRSEDDVAGAMQSHGLREGIARAIDTIGDSSASGGNQGLTQNEGSRGSIRELIILLIVIPYLVNLASDAVNPIVLKYLASTFQTGEEAPGDARSTAKVAANDARDILRGYDIKRYRVVIGSALHVRSSASRNAEIVDELEAGKIVRLLDKNRYWCHVEYHDLDTDEVRYGWVYGRYLRRLER